MLRTVDVVESVELGKMMTMFDECVMALAAAEDTHCNVEFEDR